MNEEDDYENGGSNYNPCARHNSIANRDAQAPARRRMSRRRATPWM